MSPRDPPAAIKTFGDHEVITPAQLGFSKAADVGRSVSSVVT